MGLQALLCMRDLAGVTLHAAIGTVVLPKAEGRLHLVHLLYDPLLRLCVPVQAIRHTTVWLWTVIDALMPSDWKLETAFPSLPRLGSGLLP